VFRLRLVARGLCRLDVARQRLLLAADHAAPRGQIAIVEHGEQPAALDCIADVGIELPHGCRDARGERDRDARLHRAGAGHLHRDRTLRGLDDRHRSGAQ
jgi:hypothetical protein